MEFTGKNIRKIRSVKGLSQSAFGALFSVSRSNIGAYEEARATPKMELTILIAKYFGIDLERILTKELTVNEISGFSAPEIDKESKITSLKSKSSKTKQLNILLQSVSKIEEELQALKTAIKKLEE